MAEPARRTGEKIGWLGGWGGAFAYPIGTTGYFLAIGDLLAAGGCAVLLLVGGSGIWFCAPWRHPDVRYWKLLLPIAAAWVAGLVWIFANAPPPERAGLEWWHAGLLLPAGLVFWRYRRWTWRAGVSGNHRT